MLNLRGTRVWLSAALISTVVSAGAMAQGLGNPWDMQTGGGQLPPGGTLPPGGYPGAGHGGIIPPVGGAPQSEWPGYDATIINVRSIYQKLMIAKRNANVLGARGQFDAASQKLIVALDEIRALAQWNYGRPAPTTIAAAQAARAVANSVVHATQGLGAELGAKVRFITISDFFKTLQWAYDVDTNYYRMIVSNPYGDFPRDYFTAIQRLGKLFLEIQGSIANHQASNQVELRVTREVSKAVRYILANSTLRRALESVGFELLYVEQLCLEAMSSPFSDPYVIGEIRARVADAARSISRCEYMPQPNYPRPPHGGIDYSYPGYGYGTSDGFGGGSSDGYGRGRGNGRGGRG